MTVDGRAGTDLPIYHQSTITQSPSLTPLLRLQAFVCELCNIKHLLETFLPLADKNAHSLTTNERVSPVTRTNQTAMDLCLIA